MFQGLFVIRILDWMINLIVDVVILDSTLKNWICYCTNHVTNIKYIMELFLLFNADIKGMNWTIDLFKMKEVF